MKRCEICGDPAELRAAWYAVGTTRPGEPEPGPIAEAYVCRADAAAVAGPWKAVAK